MDPSDLRKCVDFLNEVEALKTVYRQNMAVDGSRQENSAEHSWHIALMAILLSDCADAKGLDLFRVVKMLLIHDLVEIDTGDTFLYDIEANKDKDERESATARRIFGLLPEGSGSQLMKLWREFEARSTPEAQFAAALDGLQPLMNHLASKGAGIKKHDLRTSQVLDSKRHIEEASAQLWELAQNVIHRSEAKGLYRP